MRFNLVRSMSSYANMFGNGSRVKNFRISTDAMLVSMTPYASANTHSPFGNLDADNPQRSVHEIIRNYDLISICSFKNITFPVKWAF
ncbi:hypothetical protein CEXT_189911 [Caerostris extrusa]|uniref:Uncharacterized protein n=1 Tax=Caerostris extrusa TaxID=172846 RepID=A0AAV4R9Y3_CAEEX|nr:hypothetical protein CEXT_189911 [Caerostris extrusa]